ncbi:T9SS type A sorting domain-containing protein, partial [candidate division KSB1 bacterium]|nr:T9SS type A sorting domain-containing protein [candidate division KSB1 bacterium]
HCNLTYKASGATLKIQSFHNGVNFKSGPVRIIRDNLIKVNWLIDLGILGDWSGDITVPIGFRYYKDFFEVPYNSISLNLQEFLSKMQEYKVSLRYSSIYYTMMLNDNGKNMRFYTPRLLDPADRITGFKIDHLFNEGYIYTDDIGELKSGEWPGQQWYAISADLVDPASTVQRATVYTHLTLNGNAPATDKEYVWFIEQPGDAPTLYGDAGIRLYQSRGLPQDMSLDVNFKYYVFPIAKTYDELETFFSIQSNALSVATEWESNDKTPPAMLAVSISARTETTLTLRWTAVGDDGLSGGPAQVYYIRYDTIPPDNIWAWWATAGVVSPVPTPGPPGSTDEITLMLLEPNQAYYIGIRVLDDVGNASDIAFVTETTTPVELATFTARVVKDRILLNWATHSETNNFGFDVERRLSAATAYERIAFVGGAGTSTSPRSYTYVDQPQHIGRVYYRLKQIDTDGRTTYSDEVMAQVSAPQSFVLTQNYPNPFNPNTTFSYQIPEGVSAQVELIIYDLLGRKVRTLLRKAALPGYYQTTWDGRDDDGRMTGSGVYIYILRSGQQQIARKMIKVD